IPDPTDSKTFNRYTYVNNNPLRYTDPSGHICLECGLDVLKGAASAIVSNNYDSAFLPKDYYYRQQVEALKVDNQNNFAFQTGRFIGSLITMAEGVAEIAAGTPPLVGGTLAAIPSDGVTLIAAGEGAAVMVHGGGNFVRGGLGALESGNNILKAVTGQ